MSIEVFKWIVEISTAFTAVALILCLYKFSKRSLEVKLQAVAFLLSVMVALYVKIWEVQGAALNVPQNLYIVPYILLLLAMYDVAWKGRHRVLTVISTTVVCVFALGNFLFLQQDSFNSHTLVLGGVFVILHGVLYYYYLLVNLPVQKLGKLPMFWFNAGYLTYFGGSLFIFAAYVVEVFRDSLLLYWSIQNFLRIAQFILIIVGLCQDLRNIRLHSSLPSAH